ncbi:MAG: CsgG/HfaB family protein [Pseudomonadota bacterium]
MKSIQNFAGAMVLCAMAATPAASAAEPARQYDGPRKTVSVDMFQATDATGGAVTADGMTTMLTNALIKDGRFVVVERPAMTALQAEQALGQMGAANAETAAKSGQLIGASILVRGVVTKFQAAASGGGLNIGSSGFGKLLGGMAGLKSQTSMMEISLRLIDTATGQVVSTATAQGTVTSKNLDASLFNPKTGLSLGGGAFENTPAAQAGEQAIIKALEQISAGMENVPWSALVIDASNGVVYLNAGADRKMAAGTTLGVYRKGKVLTDPGTGVVLDVEFEKIGTIRVVGVREKVSTAAVESGETPERGNVLKLN